MSSSIPRIKETPVKVFFPPPIEVATGKPNGSGLWNTAGVTTSKLWRSEGHPINRKTGLREGGGEFHVTHSGPLVKPGALSNVIGGNSNNLRYSGPVNGTFVPRTAIGEHYAGTVADLDSSSLNALGATAISQCAPNNPTANLSTTLAETFREGVPSLPGIQSWKRRTEILRAAGSEYLNYQFGWAPLQSEVNNVVNATRHHRDILQNYRHNEGRDVHRRFDFSPESSQWDEELAPADATAGLSGGATYLVTGRPHATRVTSARIERKRWFEGCFTYGGPSGTDSFRRAIGFGSDADAVYGLNLSPDVLWELTPWSWAVDWFTNAGDVIHNISNFAAAGLVMRYGFMMEESIETYYTQYGDAPFRIEISPGKYSFVRAGHCTMGKQVVRRSRVPANPFGFGVGWEGLSPTQLAITAALGITRLL